VARALLAQAGLPIAAPCANTVSGPSPTQAAHVMQDLAGRVDLVLDAGPTPIGVESTIVDLSVEPPVLRRPGGVSLEALRVVVPRLAVATVTGRVDEAQVSPGQLGRHYAPRATLTLYTGSPDSVVRAIGEAARRLAAQGRRVGVLAPEEDVMALAPIVAAGAATGRILSRAFGARRDPDRAAHELFASLRALDADGVDCILASCPEGTEIGRAIQDRLTRAAQGGIVDCRLQIAD
jgi:L-threonylcarbamoyladenylate synthase